MYFHNGILQNQMFIMRLMDTEGLGYFLLFYCLVLCAAAESLLPDKGFVTVCAEFCPFAWHLLFAAALLQM